MYTTSKSTKLPARTSQCHGEANAANQPTPSNIDLEEITFLATKTKRKARFVPLFVLLGRGRSISSFYSYVTITSTIFRTLLFIETEKASSAHALSSGTTTA